MNLKIAPLIKKIGSYAPKVTIQFGAKFKCLLSNFKQTKIFKDLVEKKSMVGLTIK